MRRKLNARLVACPQTIAAYSVWHAARAVNSTVTFHHCSSRHLSRFQCHRLRSSRCNLRCSCILVFELFVLLRRLVDVVTFFSLLHLVLSSDINVEGSAKFLTKLLWFGLGLGGRLKMNFDPNRWPLKSELSFLVLPPIGCVSPFLCSGYFHLGCVFALPRDLSSSLVA